jgi:hypothetical protein
VNAMQGRVPGHPDIRQSRPPDTRFSNTAGLSGELSKGDVVVIGEVALAVASVGWAPVSSGLAEVRTKPARQPAPARNAATLLTKATRQAPAQNQGANW